MGMRRSINVFFGCVALLLLISTSAWSQEGHDGDYKEPGGAPHGMSMTASSLKQRLGLSDDQAGKLRKLRGDYLKSTILQTANVRVAELELNDLLDESKLSKAKIEKKVKEMESIRAELTLTRVRFLLKAADFMTPEQFDKFRAMTVRRMSAAGAHGPTGFKGHGKKPSSSSSPHGPTPPGTVRPHQ